MEGNQLLTAHMVDDAAPWEEAMKDFFLYSSFSFMHTTMAADGRSVIYTITDPANSQTCIRRAQNTIDVLRLPLVAKLDETVIGGQVAKVCLLIKYTGK